jgi:small subunit ribosomal protein S2
VSRGGYVLFVGTKKQAKNIIEQSAVGCGQHYVTERWLGGMLTNFPTIRRSIGRLQELERMMNETSFDLIGKKERLRLDKERERLLKVFVGIKGMDQLPSVVFVVDTVKEKIAVSEAQKLGIPLVGIVDTNSDPDFVSHPIPANDDAIRSIQLLTEAVADAVREGAARSRAVEARAEKAEIEELMDREEAPRRPRASVPEETPAVAKE